MIVLTSEASHPIYNVASIQYLSNNIKLKFDNVGMTKQAIEQLSSHKSKYSLRIHNYYILIELQELVFLRNNIMGNRTLAEILYRMATSNENYSKKIDLIESKLDQLETKAYNDGIKQFTDCPRFLRDE